MNGWEAMPIGSTRTVILLPHSKPLPAGFDEHPHDSHHGKYGRIALERIEPKEQGGTE